MLDVSFFLLGLNVNSIIASGDFTQIDPINGTYTFNGATVALSDIIDTTNSDWFHPATDIDAGGIKMCTDDGVTGFHGKNIHFTGALLAQCLSGFTTVEEILTGALYCAMDTYSQNDPDGTIWSDVGIEFNFEASTFRQYLFAPPDGTSFINQTNPPDVVPTVASASIIKVAKTFASDRIAISIDGHPATVLASPGLNAAINDIEFATGGGPSNDTTGRIRKFTIYPVQADADLPALTAP